MEYNALSNKCIILGTNAEWLDFFIPYLSSHPELGQAPIYLKRKDFDYIIHSPKYSDNTIPKAYEQFGMHNGGYTIFHRFVDLVRSWYFIDATENASLEQVHTKIEKFKKFIAFLTPHISLLKQEFGTQCTYFLKPPFYELEERKFFLADDQLIKEIEPKEYLLYTLAGEVKFSKRMVECIFLLSKGYKNKKIAKILKLSPRTVEDYLEKIRNKIGCATKDEILTHIDTSLIPNMIEYFD